jgi:DNA-binding NtrC family response regulator
MQESKVLIVDEEPEFSAILTNRLCSWGFAATSAGNSEEAMASIALNRPDVVVLSLRTGHVQDLDTLSLIKDFDSVIEVILLIGKGAARAGMQGIERGAFDCLPQPIELGILIEKIRQACGQCSRIPGDASGLPLILPILVGDDSAGIFSSLLLCLQSMCNVSVVF